MQKIRVAAVQFEHVYDNKPANIAKIENFCQKAAQQGAQVICFPECCISGYWLLRKFSKKQLEDIAEPVPSGPSSRQLLALAAKYKVILGAGLIEKAAGGKLFNSFVVALPDGRWHVHHKLRAFISQYVSSGSEYTVFETPIGWKLGVLTCYDNNIVENVRITALLGADLILAPHQTGGCNLKNPHAMGLVERKLWDNRQNAPAAIEAELKGPKGRGWLMRWLPSRAHDNGVFYIFSNGVGPDDDEVRTGNAMILDPYGRILSETGKAADDMVVADLDPALLERCSGKRWMRTRRPELYAPICQPRPEIEDVRKVRFEQEKGMA